MVDEFMEIWGCECSCPAKYISSFLSCIHPLTFSKSRLLIDLIACSTLESGSDSQSRLHIYFSLLSANGSSRLKIECKFNVYRGNISTEVWLARMMMWSFIRWDVTGSLRFQFIDLFDVLNLSIVGSSTPIWMNQSWGLGSGLVFNGVWIEHAGAHSLKHCH
jgi:hypothetical protein